MRNSRPPQVNFEFPPSHPGSIGIHDAEAVISSEAEGRIEKSAKGCRQHCSGGYPIDPSTPSLRSLGRDENFKTSVVLKGRWDKEGVIPSEAQGRVEESMDRAGALGKIPHSSPKPHASGGWADGASSIQCLAGGLRCFLSPVDRAVSLFWADISCYRGEASLTMGTEKMPRGEGKRHGDRTVRGRWRDRGRCARSHQLRGVRAAVLFLSRGSFGVGYSGCTGRHVWDRQRGLDRVGRVGRLSPTIRKGRSAFGPLPAPPAHPQLAAADQAGRDLLDLRRHGQGGRGPQYLTRRSRNQRGSGSAGSC